MCGIAGIVRPARAPALDPAGLEVVLRRFAAALGHRGPDTNGIVLSRRAGLAHTRLSIIDLSPAGAQPMFSPDRRFVLAFNGEVYNFCALREDLEAKGERFTGHSDTEVVLRLLIREGSATLAKLDGMFALALLDTTTDEILVARDRTGQKPLYLAPLSGGGWSFASEILPLLGVEGVDRAIDPLALSYLLTLGFSPAPFTLRRGIRQLRPGTFFRLGSGEEREERFAPEPGPGSPILSGGFDALSHELEHVLSDAVRSHLVADVPVGVLLSGGVDSSVIAALAARHAGRVKTFCVVHADPRYDERKAARAVASAIGSDHHEIALPHAGLSEDDLDVLVDHHGDPFVDSSSLNVLYLSREMRRHVTVAISGDGGDEVFAGYPRFGHLRWLSRLGHLPQPLLGASVAALSRLPGEGARRAARSFLVAAMTRPRRATAFNAWFWPEEQAALLRPEWTLPQSPAALDGLLIERGALLVPDAAAAAHWMEQRLHLPDDMLTKVDRMSMAASLEVRPPLLANSVIDFAARLPFDTKLDGGSSKRILRAVARRLVPAWVIDRPKQGFALNLLAHGGAVLESATRFALESRESPLQALFQPEALRSLAAEFAGNGVPGCPEDSTYRRVHRQWLIVMLARTLARHG